MNFFIAIMLITYSLAYYFLILAISIKSVAVNAYNVGTNLSCLPVSLHMPTHKPASNLSYKKL